MSRSDAEERASLASAKRIVVKIGSRLLAESPAGRPAHLADQLAHLRATRGVEPVIVSSGAIALGMRALKLNQRPQLVPQLQAAAAIGQNRLMQHWEHAFAAHDLLIAQVLLSHDDVASRKRFLNARNALRAIIEFGATPIINENDTVAVEEITYGDNDQLAALLCNVVSADALIILTDVEGVRGGAGTRLPVVRDIDSEALPHVQASLAGSLGSGGMASKISAAGIAGRAGVTTVIAGGREPDVLSKVLTGQDVGTLFVPADRITSRKHWLAYGPRPAGSLVLDAGATKAVRDLGGSLLPAGIAAVDGDFERGEIVTLADPTGREFARGLAGYSAADVRKIKGNQTAAILTTLGYKYVDEVVHRDDLVLL